MTFSEYALIILFLGCWNNNRVSTESVLKLLMIQLDRILEDPRVQICGLRVFIDFTGVSPSLLDTINPKKTIKDLSKVLQVSFYMYIHTFFRSSRNIVK